MQDDGSLAALNIPRDEIFIKKQIYEGNL